MGYYWPTTSARVSAPVAEQGRGGVSSSPANMLSFNKLLLCDIGQGPLFSPRGSERVC